MITTRHAALSAQDRTGIDSIEASFRPACAARAQEIYGHRDIFEVTASVMMACVRQLNESGHEPGFEFRVWGRIGAERFQMARS